MKNNYIVLSLVVSLLFFGGCKKALDQGPDGKLSIDEVFEDNEKVAAFLNTCYLDVPVKGASYFFFQRGPVNLSDEAWDTAAEVETGLMSARMYNGDATSKSHPIMQVSAFAGNGDYWPRYWKNIRNSTLFINRIDKATVKNPADRARWKAEAHLLRAYFYSELLKWFGPSLPIEREVIDFATDFSKLKKESYYDVVKFIMEDCDVALSTPELPWRISTQAEDGRVSKALAEAIKSKMILFAASPLNNGGANYWKEAYEVNKTSLENLKKNGYELYNAVNFPQTYLSEEAFLGPDKNMKTAIYNEYFTQTMRYSSTPIDKETIFQSTANQNILWVLDGIGAQGGIMSGACPSQELVDSYETLNGMPILDLKNPYLDEKHLQPNYNTANNQYNPNNPYENRDPRFYASIYYNGSKRNCFWAFAEAPGSYENYPAPVGNRTRKVMTYVGEPQTGIHPDNRKATRTGYFIRKFLHPNSGDDNQIMGANWKLFRLGEVILNFAEAAAEAGELQDATRAVNEIRSRAGMPDLSFSLTKDELILRIRNERRVELAMEENRYFDIRRWTLPNGDLSKTDRWITAMEITRKGEGIFTYNRRTVRTNERRNYTNKYLWIPLPLNESNRLKGSTGIDWQNKGW